MMKFIDITRQLSPEILIYPGDSDVIFKKHERGQFLITDLSLSTHTGTHIDAPSHYLKTGATIDSIPLNYLIGKCKVLDLSEVENSIDANYLHGKIQQTERLLLKTSFSGANKFVENYPHLTKDAAKYITRYGMKCIGIDSPSIESYQSDGSVHRELLGHGCIIIELLDLSNVNEGEYAMIALPLPLAGLDGSPARVVLYSEEE